MKKLILMLLISFILASCVTSKPTYFYHATKPASEFERDKQACMYEAEKYGHVAMYGTGVGAGLEEGMRKNKLAKMCLEQKGWAQDPSQVSTSQNGHKYTWRVNSTEMQVVENEYFKAQVNTKCQEDQGCRTLIINITNKTDKNIEVNWLKTFYIQNAERKGTFTPVGKNNFEVPDIILPEGHYVKVIFPSKLTVINKFATIHEAMPEGENGVDLTVLLDGKEVNEKLLLILTKK